MNKPEPTRMKLNLETPNTKNVSKIPMPSLDKNTKYDIDMIDDIYIPTNNTDANCLKKQN